MQTDHFVSHASVRVWTLLGAGNQSFGRCAGTKRAIAAECVEY